MPRDLTEDQRWDIAHDLNGIPTSCWADLVTWASRGYSIAEDDLGETSRSPLPDTTSGGWCAMDAARSGCCYCGKFRTGLEVTGVA